MECLVAPHRRHSYIGCCHRSSRMAPSKLRAPGGKVPILTVCAPHNGRPHPARSNFSQREASRPAARGEQQPGRAPMFGSPAAQHSTSTGTGALLLELRAASKPAAGNTFFTAASESLVTGYNAGPHPHDAHNYKRFGTCTLMCSRFDWPV
ncbi:unnamed protein product [Prorocentrum cordatum]|uniref:Uncharacterized protein n=1 Tax=Prorocentrum cordatum TaxID=2364126 RepID=A0ABN9X7E3_9DINO|nr:unnamed protein product [Polarella glacialis]